MIGKSLLGAAALLATVTLSLPSRAEIVLSDEQADVVVAGDDFGPLLWNAAYIDQANGYIYTLTIPNNIIVTQPTVVVFPTIH